MANRGEAVGDGQGVLALVGEVEDGRAEDRPIAMEQHSPRQPQFLLVAQVLDGRVDVSIQAQIADLNVGLVGADGEVELASTQRPIVLVELDTIAEAYTTDV